MSPFSFDAVAFPRQSHRHRHRLYHTQRMILGFPQRGMMRGFGETAFQDLPRTQDGTAIAPLSRRASPTRKYARGNPGKEVVSEGLVDSGSRRRIIQKAVTAIIEVGSQSGCKEVQMKKLAVVVMMTAIATFTPAAMASAQGGWGAIQGTYAMTAVGNCLHTWSSPSPPFYSGLYGASNMVQGFFQFSKDGTGTAWGENWPIVPPPGPSVLGVGHGAFSFNFTYHVTDEGAITVGMMPGSFAGTNLVNGATFISDNCGGLCTMSGMVSSDHKTMTLATQASPDGSQIQGYTFTNGPTPINGKTMYANCSIARTLFRVTKAE